MFDLGRQLQRALGWKRMSILAGACPGCFGIGQVFERSSNEIGSYMLVFSGIQYMEEAILEPNISTHIAPRSPLSSVVLMQVSSLLASVVTFSKSGHAEDCLVDGKHVAHRTR